MEEKTPQKGLGSIVQKTFEEIEKIPGMVVVSVEDILNKGVSKDYTPVTSPDQKINAANGDVNGNGNGNGGHPSVSGTCVSIRIDLNKPYFKANPNISTARFQNAFESYLEEKGIGPYGYDRRTPERDIINIEGNTIKSDKIMPHTTRIRYPDEKSPKFSMSLDADRKLAILSYLKDDEKGKEIITGFYKRMHENQLPLEILLVDDEQCWLTLNKGIIERSMNGRKYNIDTAPNGSRAIDEVIKKGEYDLIITDYKMPLMNGIEFYKELKKINPEQQAKVVMYSGDNLDDIKKIVEESLSPEDYKLLPLCYKDEHIIATMKDILKPLLG